jgi:hypothetical protein
MAIALHPDFITVICKCSGPFRRSWCRPSCKENRRAGLQCDFSMVEMRYDRNSNRLLLLGSYYWVTYVQIDWQRCAN